jgi:hypothetical protein
MCNCIHLDLRTQELPYLNTSNYTQQPICLLKEDTLNLKISVQINQTYHQQTGKLANGPQCFYYSNPDIACSQCPAYQEK